MKIEMHGHTFYSDDAIISPDDYVKAAKKEGLNSVAVTDHNTTKGWKRALSAGKMYGIDVIKAEEVKVFHNGKKIGEVLAYFINEEIKPDEFHAVKDAIKSQGGIMVVAHPFDTFRANFKMIEEYKKHMDGVEAVNARVLLNRFNRRARAFAEENGLGVTGGSDSHCRYEVGNAFTVAEISDINELPKALKNRQTRAYGKRTNPMIHSLSTLTKLGFMRPKGL
ncbi:MAG: PHP domain-containing protein [Candidatus Aenigmarchaeota archaeon]|nr:PHP domain-containing protein [Candidatus Aenigmarchaeota archaeon]